MNSLKVNKIQKPQELVKAFAIRKIVFVEEQGCPANLELANEEEAVHFLAVIHNEPCGACRWRKTELGYKLERFAVLQKFRGCGVGKAMVAAVLDDLPADANYIYLNSQLDAVGLYERFGFTIIGDIFEEAGIRHYKMVRHS